MESNVKFIFRDPCVERRHLMC